MSATAGAESLQSAKSALLKLEALLEGIRAMNHGSNEALLAEFGISEVNVVAVSLDEISATAGDAGTGN